MRAGGLRHPCTLQRLTSEPDGMGGQKTPAWVAVGTLWAEITLPTGRVATVANQVQELITAEIRIRYRADIEMGMRLVTKNATYSIQAHLPDNEQTMLRLLCANVPNLRKTP